MTGSRKILSEDFDWTDNNSAEIEPIVFISPLVVIIIVLSIVAAIVAAIACVCCCVCRRRRNSGTVYRQAPQQATTYYHTPPVQYPAASPQPPYQGAQVPPGPFYPHQMVYPPQQPSYQQQGVYYPPPNQPLMASCSGYSPDPYKPDKDEAPPPYSEVAMHKASAPPPE